MGILDSIYSATYSAYSATEKAKQIAPDLTPVTAACRSSCNYSWTAVTKVNSVIVENVVPTLNYYVYDEQGREMTGRVAVSFAKHAAFEGLKWVPGLIQYLFSPYTCACAICIYLHFFLYVISEILCVQRIFE